MEQKPLLLGNWFRCVTLPAKRRLWRLFVRVIYLIVYDSLSWATRQRSALKLRCQIVPSGVKSPELYTTACHVRAHMSAHSSMFNLGSYVPLKMWRHGYRTIDGVKYLALGQLVLYEENDRPKNLEPHAFQLFSVHVLLLSGMQENL